MGHSCTAVLFLISPSERGCQPQRRWAYYGMLLSMRSFVFLRGLVLLDVELLVWTHPTFITEGTQYPSGHFKCDMVKVERHHVHSRDKVVATLYKAVMFAILGIPFYSLCSVRWIGYAMWR